MVLFDYKVGWWVGRNSPFRHCGVGRLTEQSSLKMGISFYLSKAIGVDSIPSTLTFKYENRLRNYQVRVSMLLLGP